MKLSLIGMSEVGKTMWAKRLEALQYKRFSCDDVIEEKLGAELLPLGYSGIEDVAKWLGQPYEERYTKNSKRYLELEEESMKEILDTARADEDSDIVIDTTGSVIYLDESIVSRMKDETTVVYLETPQSVQDEMYELFLAYPKPLMWADQFAMQAGESKQQALARCYPELLRTRTEKYRQYADVTIDYYNVRKDDFSPDDFISLILSYGSV